MSEFEDKLLNKIVSRLTDKTLTSEELSDYEDLFESDNELKIFVYGMHVATAKDGFREILLALLQAGIPVEAVIYSQTEIWLKRSEAFDPDFDQEMVNNWLNQGMALLEILYAASVDALRAEREKEPELGDSGYGPELEDMYAQWREHMIFIEDSGSMDDVDQAKFMELSDYCKQHLEALESNFVNEAKLELSAEDLHSIWTDLLMQTYSFAYTQNPDTYFYMTTYWESHVYEHIRTDIMDLMVHFKGSEELLSIENRPYLKTIVAHLDDFRAAIQSGLFDPSQIDDMNMDDMINLFETIEKQDN